MAKTIYVNLPVADVAKAAAFYEAIGFEKNEQFSNAQCAAMTWSDAIRVMLMSHEFFGGMTNKTVGDPKTVITSAFALALESRDEVDAINAAAVQAGGRELHDAEDHGFMYSRAFEDLDGHSFGPFWMDVAAMPAQAA